MIGFGHLQEQIAHRKTFKKCNRCNILYKKALDECPHCSGVSDIDLNLLLDKRKGFRLGLGSSMFLGALAILVLIFIFNS